MFVLIPKLILLLDSDCLIKPPKDSDGRWPVSRVMIIGEDIDGLSFSLNSQALLSPFHQLSLPIDDYPVPFSCFLFDVIAIAQETHVSERPSHGVNPRE
jgi:hypothetical protein